MEDLVKDTLDFYKGKRVLVTGHTGFKGTWLCKILSMIGAEVIGYALEPNTNPNLFQLSNIERHITHIIGDIRDYDSLYCVFDETRPQIVFHLAAQPIVLESYNNPKYTYETNVIGTVNLLECIRKVNGVQSVLNVTTDKVYRNNEWIWGYRENDVLDGFDPYSNSKSCSDLITSSYVRSFLGDMKVPVSTARAGNVIGGGDFSQNRIIPDCIKAVCTNGKIKVRNPYSIRPYQHVLEPLNAYLLITSKQALNINISGSYNVGPDDQDCITTSKLVDLFCSIWGDGAEWEDCSQKNALHEANFLKLDCSKIKSVLGWKPRWHIEDAIRNTCEFTRIWIENGNIEKEMEREILQFIN